jgi:hypothetical protein
MPLRLLIKGEADSPPSYYDWQHVLVARAGDPIARIVEPTDEQRRADPLAIIPMPTLGENVGLAGDGVTILARASGRVYLRDETIGITQVLQIVGDVDFSSGNIDYPNDIVVGGSVRDLFKVRSANGSIAVGGAIDAAQVSAAQDVQVGGGVVGRGKGAVAAGGSLAAKYLDNVQVSAGRDLVVRNDITACTVVCGGDLLARNGSIIKSNLTVSGQIEAGTVGSPAGFPMTVELGHDAHFRRAAPPLVQQIDARLARLADIRRDLDPLVSRLKLLSADQREKATELLFQASQIEAAARQTLEQLEQLYRNAVRMARASRMLVQNTLHAGVQVRFYSAEAAVVLAMQGPLVVKLDETSGDRPIISVLDLASNRAIPLETRPRRDETFAAVERMLDRAGAIVSAAATSTSLASGCATAQQSEDSGRR